MTRISPPVAALDALAEPLRRVGEGEHVILDRDGRSVAALISVEDLQLLESLIEREENRLDIEAVRQARADLAAGKTDTIPWQDVEARLDRIKD